MKDFAIHICTIDLETGNSTSEQRIIRESSSGISEGSHIFKRGKYYYLLTAEGGTGSEHSQSVSRSETGPFGPWEVAPHNPLCRNGPDDEIQNIGHADLVEDAEGRWWSVLLGVRPVMRGDGWENSVFGTYIHILTVLISEPLTSYSSGRETFLVPVSWVDDWPVFNRGSKVSLQSTAPDLYPHEIPITWRDDFSAPSLQLGWHRKSMY